ncbi:MAG: thermonuclease family protein [Hyphomicrobiaceae bacterium]
MRTAARILGALVLAGALSSLLAVAVSLVEGKPKLSGSGRAIDGDTLVVGGTRVRLKGIDAPELHQVCGRREGGSWRCGLESARALARMIEGRTVVCADHGRDPYGRTLGVCFADRVEINAEMVRRGLAWAFVRYSRAYVKAEAEARAARRGIWQGQAVPAWRVRRRSQVSGAKYRMSGGGCQKVAIELIDS